MINIQQGGTCNLWLKFVTCKMNKMWMEYDGISENVDNGTESVYMIRFSL